MNDRLSPETVQTSESGRLRVRFSDPVSTDYLEPGQTPKPYEDYKMSTITDQIPAAMVDQIVTMRRNPSEFIFLGMSRCKLCYKKCAFDIGHPLAASAGTWCPDHGWLYFASNTIRPTGEEYIPKKKKRAA